MGGVASSILDENTKPVAVYSVDLVEGERVLFELEASNGMGTVRLYNPGTTTIENAKSGDEAFGDYGSSGWSREFIPAVSGTYYLRLAANRTSQPYAISLRRV